MDEHTHTANPFNEHLPPLSGLDSGQHSSEVTEYVHAFLFKWLQQQSFRRNIQKSIQFYPPNLTHNP